MIGETAKPREKLCPIKRERNVCYRSPSRCDWGSHLWNCYLWLTHSASCHFPVWISLPAHGSVLLFTSLASPPPTSTGPPTRHIIAIRSPQLFHLFPGQPNLWCKNVRSVVAVKWRVCPCMTFSICMFWLLNRFGQRLYVTSSNLNGWDHNFEKLKIKKLKEGKRFWGFFLLNFGWVRLIKMAKIFAKRSVFSN